MDVFVAGVAASASGNHARTTAELAYEAARAAIEDAGLGDRQVPVAFVGPGALDPYGIEAVAVHLGLRRAGLGRRTRPPCDERPGRIEHISGSGAEALHRACQAIELGLFDIVLCIGAGQEAATEGAVWPPAPLWRARADAARRYMTATRATVEQLARVAAKNHAHGARNPRVPSRARITVREILAAQDGTWPLNRLMVAPYGVGAAAVVLVSAAERRRLHVAAPRVRASVLVTAGADETDCTPRAARLAYAAAGVGPEDLGCAEVGDVTAAAELAAYEALQFAPDGQGPELIDSGFTALGGVLPVNPSGGMLALGELPGAAGISQICELTWQLRRRAATRQVPGVRVALAHAPGGGPDGTAVTLTILTSG